MAYGQCEQYGKQPFNFFKFFKEITQQKKGWIDIHPKVDLSLDNSEEED